MTDTKGEAAKDEGEASQFFQAYEQSKDKPCYVYDVNVKGNARTKRYLIDRELEGARNAESLSEILDALLVASSQLSGLDVFKKCDLFIDVGPANRPEAVNIDVTVEEQSPYSLDAGTYVQGGEASVEGSVGLKNVLGHAERLEAAAAIGNERSNTYHLSLTQPRFRGTESVAELGIAQAIRSFQKHSSVTEKSRGLQASVSNGGHSFAYELAWRELGDLHKRASKTIRRQAGHAVKSALMHTYRLDARDNVGRPREGHFVKSQVELAGVGADSRLLRYIRSEVTVQKIFSLPLRDTALCLTGRCGLVVPWGKADEGPPITVADRFFAGGVGSLRGFKNKGLGPQDRRMSTTHEEEAEQQSGGADGAGEEDDGWSSKTDVLGGDVVATGAAQLTFGLPNRVLNVLGVYGHLFANVGTVATLEECLVCCSLDDRPGC